MSEALNFRNMQCRIRETEEELPLRCHTACCPATDILHTEPAFSDCSPDEETKNKTHKYPESPLTIRLTIDFESASRNHLAAKRSICLE